MSHAVVLSFSAMVLGACPEAPEFADWTITVPERPLDADLARWHTGATPASEQVPVVQPTREPRP